ncbi:hypothetical protein V7266_14670 [Neobacillus drentensis]|uniref:hypothetical protein n=1 Tax=Neobacillus drentensis TaxID=220684 RepID=UPI003000F8AE
MVRMIQRIIGVLLLVYGIYLIFGTQEFFGTILIILAFLIFPSLNNKKSNADSTHHDDYNHDTESSSDHNHSHESSNSTGDSGD